MWCLICLHCPLHVFLIASAPPLSLSRILASSIPPCLHRWGGGRESPATADRRAYATHSPPVPVSWCPAWNPDEWVYTDGSKQDPDPTLGAAVVHLASGLTILINATGQEELNTILRAELAAIHQALIVFRDIPTFNCLTDSLTSLQQLQTVLTRPQEVSYYLFRV